MRILTTLFFILLSQLAFGQFAYSDSKKEAKEMMALATTFTFQHLYGTDKDIVPKGYKKQFESNVVGMDNKFQVFQKGNKGYITFRGSTDKGMSWVENFYSAMVPAKGTIQLKDKDYPYHFADKEGAAVHAGFALAIIFLSEQMIPEIQALNDKGVYDIVISGHSQGGALATLTRCYLENSPTETLSEKNTYKTYAFGNPMCGNQEFAEEYKEKYADTGTAFSIINPEDPIPYMPVNYEEKGKTIDKKKIIGWLTGKEDFNFKKIGMDLFLRKFDGPIKTHITKSNTLLEKLVSLRFGNVKMPEYVRDINYFPTGERIELDVFDYPKIKAPKNLDEKELSKYELAEDGNMYKKEPMFFQHNPYNYYVGVMKKFNPKDYKKLKKKYLDVNL